MGSRILINECGSETLPRRLILQVVEVQKIRMEPQRLILEGL
jgi:hypothetical protein